MKKLLQLSSVVGVLCLFAGCVPQENKKQTTRPPIPAIVAKMHKSNVIKTIKSIGQCKASQEVELVAQVVGEIKEVNFQAGSWVTQNDLLFSIDDRKYVANLQLAQAQLEKAKAQLAIDEAQLERSRSLVQDEYISKQEFETYEARVNQDRANILAAEASIINAEVDLEHCQIRAPFDGYIGKSEVDPGDVVNGSTFLVSLKQFTPMYVDYFVSENDFVHLRNAFTQNGNSLDISISLVGNESITCRGKLYFLDNYVDKSTGIVSLRGEFNNSDLLFWPGNSVIVKTELEHLNNVLTVHPEAIRLDAKSSNFVYKVVPDSTSATGFKATKAVIKIAYREENLAVIGDGLSEGDSVVLRGNIMLGEGSDIISMPDQQAK